MNRLLLTAVWLIHFSTSCRYTGKDFEYTSTELRHAASFREGDTIYYESLSGNVDTILIYKIEHTIDRYYPLIMGKPPENVLSVAIKNLPEGKLSPGDSIARIKGKMYRPFQHLLLMSKMAKSQETQFFIDFKDFYKSYDSKYFEQLRTDTIYINGQTITNYYEIKMEYKENVAKPNNIIVLYWTDKEGLLAYKNMRGECWLKRKIWSS